MTVTRRITYHNDYVDNQPQLTDHPILDQIYRARGIEKPEDLETSLQGLLDFDQLLGMSQAVERLYQALQHQECIMILGDFDVDGATSCTVAIKALTALGSNSVYYQVPNRFEFGYGLTPEIVDVVYQDKAPDLIVTVDNGIANHQGVDRANELGIDVVVTDHHLPAETLPAAYAIVNPNQPNDSFPSKCLAGCGVIFYVLLALRKRLREVGWFEQQGLAEPNMGQYLDLVALGTVADVVPLDKNNRILVDQGLKRIRNEQCCAGIKALLEISKRRLPRVGASDLSFAVAPRLNAAGRLEDMTVGIECLLSKDSLQATQLAFQLQQLNDQRRTIEDEMKQQAFNILKQLDVSEQQQDPDRGICLFGPEWHQGVIGIVASRLKDHWYRPTIVFAPDGDEWIKGSGRSISEVHMRDLLARIDARHPELIDKFGGHAMAAGLSLKRCHFDAFRQAFQKEISELLAGVDVDQRLLCDAQLREQDLSVEFAAMLERAGPWGHHFPEPLFANRFYIVEQRIVGHKHLKMVLAKGDCLLDGIAFNVDLERWPNHRCRYAQIAYRLVINEFRGRQNPQAMIEFIEPLTEESAS